MFEAGINSARFVQSIQPERLNLSKISPGWSLFGQFLRLEVVHERISPQPNGLKVMYETKHSACATVALTTTPHDHYVDHYFMALSALIISSSIGWMIAGYYWLSEGTPLLKAAAYGLGLGCTAFACIIVLQFAVKSAASKLEKIRFTSLLRNRASHDKIQKFD